MLMQEKVWHNAETDYHGRHIRLFGIKRNRCGSTSSSAYSASWRRRILVCKPSYLQLSKPSLQHLRQRGPVAAQHPLTCIQDSTD
jgi:hypothetical protein